MTELTVGHLMATMIINGGIICCVFLMGPKFLNAALSWQTLYFNWKTRRKTKEFLKTAHKKQWE